MSKAIDDYNWPGKYEGTENQRVAEYLNTLALDGNFEEQYGSVVEPPFIWEALMLIDKPNAEAFLGEPMDWAYIIWEDEHGFFSYIGFDTEEEARSKYMANLAAYESVMTDE